MYAPKQTHQNLQKTMSQEQFSRVVEAILAGKYSWACVLILRFAGYNPLHYIPYRTYNRLVKDNELKRNQEKAQKQRQTCIHNLNHLQSVKAEEKASIQGGMLIRELLSWS